MINISVCDGLPNLLVVNGIDSSVEYRPALKAALYDPHATSPVRRGTHDFWLCFPFPPPPPGDDRPANFGHNDPEARSVGLPLRGIGDMRRMPPNPSMAVMQHWVYTAIHEMAHSWLVPASMLIRTPHGNVSPLLVERLIAAHNNGAPIEPPALLGRGNSHWNCFVNFCSYMDGVDWDRHPDQYGYSRWVQIPTPTKTIRPRNLVAIQSNSAFSDLDLYFMGAKRAEQCFPDTGGQFFWLDPKLTTGPRINYHSGIFVAFSPTDYLYFGFYNDHGKLRAERSSNAVRSNITEIGTNFQPLRNDNEAMMLRVVKEGEYYYCQARTGNSTLPDPTGHCPSIFENTETAALAPTSGDFSQWQTVGRFHVANLAPQAIGLITKTWMPTLVESKFFSFETKQGTNIQSLPFSFALPTGVVHQPLERLQGNLLVTDVPQSDAIFRREGSALCMGVPYSNSYDHWSSSDLAPKIMTRAPQGNFSFGATAKINRTIISPASGGAAAGVTMWGREHAIRVSDVIVPNNISQFWAPPGSAYKCAFIVVTNQESEIRDFDFSFLDVFRQYFDTALNVVTDGLARSNTIL